ncbi:MAG: hypothetical protein FWC10_09985 [Lentimicrobiaceae bacterium]|nr:hypothetical protein [Lentimicrobiaceae bacterium]
MRVFGKKIDYWKEKYGGVAWGFILSTLVFLLSPELSNWKEFVRGIPTIGMLIFGFLLTFLGIILQGRSETIEWMKSRDVLFQRFISFHRRIVIVSITLSVYAFFIAYFNFEWLINSIFTDYLCLWIVVQKLLISVFVFLSVWFLYDVMHFINIFYLLIKKN